MRTINGRARRVALATSTVLLLLPSCMSPHPSRTRGVLDVTVKDFKIEPALLSLGAGRITITVRNEGPSTHEFVVVRSNRSDDDLPIAADGLSVDEDGVVPIDELSEVGSGTQGTLTLSLAPGRYVFFCNLEGHYLGGMHASIEVTGDA